MQGSARRSASPAFRAVRAARVAAVSNGPCRGHRPRRCAIRRGCDPPKPSRTATRRGWSCLRPRLRRGGRPGWPTCSIERADAGGCLRFVGLFVPVAWAWMGYTYYANRFDTDDVPYRAMVSAGMAAVAAMAVAIGDFSDEGLMRFAIAYAAVRALLLAHVRPGASPHPEVRTRSISTSSASAPARRAGSRRLRHRPPARSCSGSPASPSSSGRRSSAGR